jgi:hypothetical protein
LKSCNSDSECESKNNHKGRYEDEDQDLQPIIEGYNGTETWDKDEMLIFPAFFQTSRTRSTEDTISLLPCTKEQTRRYIQYQEPFLKKPEVTIQFQRTHC